MTTMDQFNAIEKRMGHLETEMEAVNVKVDRVGNAVALMNNKVDRMVILLSGNIEMDKNDTGMIGKIKDNEARLLKLEKFKDRMTWVFVGAGALGGLNLFQLVDMILKAFGKK